MEVTMVNNVNNFGNNAISLAKFVGISILFVNSDKSVRGCTGKNFSKDSVMVIRQ